MFKLKKLHPPFGSSESPIIEASYGEGVIEVVNGLCEVRLPETRDRLLKLGYSEAVPVEGRGEEIQEASVTPKPSTATAHKLKPKVKRRR